MVTEKIKEYWEKATPMSFSPEKWSYEQKRRFRYTLQDYMQDIFRFQDFKGKEVLEIGCGSGIDAVEFAKNGAIVTATDITNNAVELTEDLAQEAGVLNLKVTKAYADDLPFKNCSFDLVYSFGVLHHIPRIDKVMPEIHRVLRPKGKVMAMLYHKDSLLFAYSIIHQHKGNGMNEAGLTRMYSERIENCPYTKAYTKDEARKLFENWFKDVEVSVHYNVIDMPGERKVKIGIDDKWELGWHLVIKGIKV